LDEIRDHVRTKGIEWVIKDDDSEVENKVFNFILEELALNVASFSTSTEKRFKPTVQPAKKKAIVIDAQQVGNNYSAMTKPQLVKICKERKLRGYSKFNKSDLAEFIKSNEIQTPVVNNIPTQSAPTEIETNRANDKLSSVFPFQAAFFDNCNKKDRKAPGWLKNIIQADDSETCYEKMTVKTLKELCRDRKLKNYSKFTKKSDLIEFIKSHECDVVVSNTDCVSNTECVSEPNSVNDSYEKMTLKQLKDLAKERGLINFSSFTKLAMVQLLKENDKTEKFFKDMAEIRPRYRKNLNLPIEDDDENTDDRTENDLDLSSSDSDSDDSDSDSPSSDSSSSDDSSSDSDESDQVANNLSVNSASHSEILFTVTLPSNTLTFSRMILENEFERKKKCYWNNEDLETQNGLWINLARF